MKIVILAMAIVVCASCGESRSISTERHDCMKRLQRIYQQLDLYAESNGGFPSSSSGSGDRTDMHSWRFTAHTSLTAYYGPSPTAPWPEDAEYAVWDEERTRGMFSARGFGISGIPNPGGHTDFFALYGSGTAFTVYQKGSGNFLSGVESDAILLVECDREVHWIEPGDVEIESILSSKSTSGLGDLEGNYPGCFAVCFADGTVWFLKDSVPASEIRKFLTVESASNHDREEVLKDYVIQKLEPVVPRAIASKSH